jgi:hypothetical protein
MDHVEPRRWPEPPAPPQKKALTATDAGCVIMIVCVLAAVLYPVFAVSHTSSHQSSCLSNVKQVTLALMMYAQDYDDRMPRWKWMDSTYSYAKNWEIYACQVVKRDDESGYGYAFERSLVGRHTTEVKKPAEQPLVFESSLLYKNATAQIRTGLMRPGRHSGSDIVSFLDGHARPFDTGILSTRWPPR